MANWWDNPLFGGGPGAQPVPTQPPPNWWDDPLFGGGPGKQPVPPIPPVPPRPPVPPIPGPGPQPPPYLRPQPNRPFQLPPGVVNPPRGFSPQDLLRRDMFNRNPELAFLGSAAQAGGGQRMQDFFRARAGDFLTRFQQHISQQLLRGGPEFRMNDPQSGLTHAEDYFQGLNYQNEYQRYSPQQRGVLSGLTAPRTRFLYR